MEECKLRSRSLRETARHQRDKSRQLIVACASKLQEKEAIIEQVILQTSAGTTSVFNILYITQMKMEHDSTLAYIARELAFLQANMLKEQQRLEAVVSDKNQTVDALKDENDRLRKLTKKLTKQQNLDDTTSPSSEDGSPKSSFSTKVEVKPRLVQAHSSVVSAIPMTPGPKPPVPSRAGINRLLQTGTSNPTAPPIPVRSTSLNSSHLERVDSGRESDLTSDVEHVSQGKPLSSEVSAPVGSNGGGQDEGFCSSHEDNVRPAQAPAMSSSIHMRQANHRHRDVQKPSDIKHRYKAKLASYPSNLAVLQEHQVTKAASAETSGGVTTVTHYWTGSFL